MCRKDVQKQQSRHKLRQSATAPLHGLWDGQPAASKSRQSDFPAFWFHRLRCAMAYDVMNAGVHQRCCKWSEMSCLRTRYASYNDKCQYESGNRSPIVPRYQTCQECQQSRTARCAALGVREKRARARLNVAVKDWMRLCCQTRGGGGAGVDAGRSEGSNAAPLALWLPSHSSATLFGHRISRAHEPRALSVLQLVSMRSSGCSNNGGLVHSHLSR